MLDHSSLNDAQLAAVTAPDGPVLVIAGAGSGKTRTLVHRLAWLTEQGVMPAEILLLTFTRKAARDMILRAQQLVGGGFATIMGGTFHGFAYSVLRYHRPTWADGPVTVMDQADALAVVSQCKSDLSIAKGDRVFPKPRNILALLSKARNKEIDIDDLIGHDAPHLSTYADDLRKISDSYAAYKRSHRLLDYDDLLFELETLLTASDSRPHLPFRHILVDEYQDTNKVQSRLVRLLTGPNASVMAVGDDAQSIYAFRGADIRNILEFPRIFPGTNIIRLEENYRSTRPILDVANAVLADALEGYGKNLFTRNPDGDAVRVLYPLSDLTQAKLVAKRIETLLETYSSSEIAVLFRAGFHSYHLEVELTRRQIPFRKFGGQKYTEAKHIKNVLSFVRLLINPMDLPSFLQVAALCPGIGPKTAQKIHATAARGDKVALKAYSVKYKEFSDYLAFLDILRARPLQPADVLTEIITKYRPFLERDFPEDYPRRLQGLEELAHIAASYTDLDTFVADLSLETTDDSEDSDKNAVILSTIHSAKGLEWDAVIILDLVEDRFPSRHAATDPEEFEEERRLMYVACTRARKILELCVPRTIYDRQSQGNLPVAKSPFITGIPFASCEEWTENYGGQLVSRSTRPQEQPDAHLAAWTKPTEILVRPRTYDGTPEMTTIRNMPSKPAAAPILGFCRHKIFGRGKIVEVIPPDKCRVNFPGLGLKVIIRDYLTMED